jgi:SprB repeat
LLNPDCELIIKLKINLLKYGYFEPFFRLNKKQIGADNQPVTKEQLYYITNDPFNVPSNKYWNILQRENEAYNVLAYCPSNAVLPDINNVRIRAIAHDISNNNDDAFAQNHLGQVLYFDIDNFKPYVDHVRMEVGGVIVYDSQWNCDNCGGIILNSENTIPFDKDMLEQNGMIIYADVSEPLADFQLNISFFDMNNVNIINISSDGKSYTFSSGPVTSINTNASRNLNFEGQDLNGNSLLNLQDFINSSCVHIPSRGLNGWENPDNIQEGSDDIHQIPCSEILVDGTILVTNPSSCGMSDGGFCVKSVDVSGGFPPYTYGWEDEEGNIINYTGCGPWGLSSGNYCFVVTDVIDCKGVKCFELAPEDQPQIIDYVLPSCVNNPNGSIYLYVYDPTNSGTTYDFSWSNGVQIQNENECELINLNQGNYSVTINSNTGACEVSESFFVPPIEGDDLNIAGTIQNTCPGTNQGAIDLSVTGGIEPFSYHWNDISNSIQDRTGLSAGTYCVTITDYCEDSEAECFFITSLETNIYLQPIPGCRNEGQMNLNVTGGTPPYSYLWSNAQITQNATGLNSGNYCVTVSDALGCTFVTCEDILIKVFYITENLPCEGFNDGSVTLYISNPENEAVNVIFQGIISIVDVPTSNTFFNVPVENLSANTDYTLDITIGDCTYAYEFQLGDKPTDKIFSHEANDVCFYDEFCDGNLIVEDGYQTDVVYNYNLAEGSWLSKCFVPGYCGETKVKEKKFKKKKVKAFVYQKILESAYNNSPFSPDYLDGMMSYFLSKGLSPCAKVKYCPANLRITATISVFDGYKSVTQLNNNCWHLDCVFPSADATFCVNEIVPDYFPNPAGNGTPENCNPKQYKVAQLIIWYDDLLALPGFAEPQESQLKLFLDVVMNDPVLLEKASCAKVTFCESDFTVIYSNINSVDCEPNSGSCFNLFPDPCTGREYDEFFVTFCNDDNIDDCDIIYNILQYDFDGFNFIPTGENELVFNIIPHLDENTTFENFGYSISEGRILPKGIFSTNTSQVFLDFTHHGRISDMINIPNIKYFIDDWDNSEIVYIEEMQDNERFAIFYEDTLTSWTNLLEANSEEIDITFLHKEKDEIIIGGTFIGALEYHSNILTETNTPYSGFLLKISKTGEISDLHVIGNIDENSKFLLNDVSGEIILSSRSKSDWISVDSNVHQIAEQGRLFSVKFDTIGSYFNSFISLDSSINLIDVSQSSSDGSMTRVVLL